MIVEVYFIFRIEPHSFADSFRHGLNIFCNLSTGNDSMVMML